MTKPIKTFVLAFALLGGFATASVAGGDLYDGENTCLPVSSVNGSVAGAGTAGILLATGAEPCT